MDALHLSEAVEVVVDVAAPEGAATPVDRIRTTLERFISGCRRAGGSGPQAS